MRRSWWLPLVVLFSSARLDAGPAKRPAVDLQAMKEAMGRGVAEPQYPSAASYAHFLLGRLAHHDGDHRGALDQLRLALASDDQSPYLLTGLAEQYARVSELEHAEGELKAVLGLHPEYAPAQLLMGRVLYESRKYARARTHLARAIKLKPNDPDAYLVLTQLCIDQGAVDEAVKVIDELGAAVPGEPVGFHRLGLALAERGDLPRAERLLLKAVDRDPGDFDAWVTLAHIFEASGRRAKAMEAYGQALQRDPESRDVLFTAGRLALRMDNLVEARAYFDQLLSLSRDPEQVVKVAFSLLAANQLDAAVQVLDQSRKNTDEPRLHFYAGLVHERLRRFERAAEAFAAVPKETGGLFLEAQLHRGISLSGAGETAAALALFGKLHAEKPDLQGLDTSWARAYERARQPKEAEALLLRAAAQARTPEVLDAMTSFYQRQDRLPDAIAFFNAGLARDPRDQVLLFSLANALEKKGEWQRAVEKMRLVLDADAGNAAAMNFIGYALAEHGGDLDEAERLVRRALAVRPDSASFLDTMGWVLFKRGDYEHAVDFLQRAVEESPDEPTLLEHLADALSRTPRKARAQAAYSRALEVLKANPDAAERRTQRAEIEKKLRSLAER